MGIQGKSERVRIYKYDLRVVRTILRKKGGKKSTSLTLIYTDGIVKGRVYSEVISGVIRVKDVDLDFHGSGVRCLIKKLGNN